MIFNNVDFDTYFKHYPDKAGYFGKYGGSYIAPELQKAMDEITEAYYSICQSRKFIAELRRIRLRASLPSRRQRCLIRSEDILHSCIV